MAYFIACYPRPKNGGEYKFDMDYYLKTHMRLQHEAHAPYGMRSYHVILPGPETPYVVQTIEYWDNLENLNKAIELSINDGPMMHLTHDIAKYTDIKDAFGITGAIQGCMLDDKLTIETLGAKGRGF